jgi:hypothetical protein
MTHYQKLAAMIFRIIGACFLVLAILSFAIALLFLLFGLFTRGGLEIAFPLFIIYTIPTTIIGLLFFKLSKNLAKRVCFDLNEE